MKRNKKVVKKDPSILVRLTEGDDHRAISDDITKGSAGLGYYKAIFGPFNIPNLIDLSVLSLIGETSTPSMNDEYETTFRGFIALDDSISFMGGSPDQQLFETTLQVIRNFLNVTTYNTLFVNFWHMEEKTTTAFTLLREAFAQLPHLEYILWICPTTFITSPYIDECFQPLEWFTLTNEESIITQCKDLFKNNLKILYLHRNDFLPKLSVRNARIEDNDELIPIIQHSNPEILSNGDNYLLADLILKQDINNRFFIGLDHTNMSNEQERIKGMLATSLDVNMSLITKIFDIDAYPDLIIQSDSVPLPPPLLITLVGDIRLIELKLLEHFLLHQNILFINFQSMKNDESTLHELYNTLKESSGGSSTLGPFDDSIYTNKSILYKYCQLLITRHPNPSFLQAIVLIGFPRSEEEAYDVGQTIIQEFDVIIELLDESEDVDEDEEETLQHHLDSIEVLRENYFKEDDPWLASSRAPFNNTLPAPNSANYTLESSNIYYYKENKKSNWLKIPLSHDNTPSTNNDRVYMNITNCLEERIQRLEGAKAINKEKPPRANAFAITALCLKDDYLSRSLDLIKLAFEEQSSLAYCLYMLSNDTVPSIALKGFNYIKTRPGISFDQSLYIIHRAFFMVEDNLSIERILPVDLPSSDSTNSNNTAGEEGKEGNNTTYNYELYDFLSNIKSQIERNDILNHLQLSTRLNDVEIYENPDDISFKFILHSRIIGLITLSKRMLTNEDLSWLRIHYHLDEVISYTRHRLRSQYVILHYCIDPIFSYYTKHLLLTIMRKCNKSIFYYHHDKDFIPCKEVIEHFHFIRPRRYPQGKHIACSTRPSNLINPITSEKVILPQEDCPLYYISKNYLSYHKKIISKRIVIIGGSLHGQTFLETLLSIYYLYLPNIYYIIDILPTSFKMNDINAANTPGNNELVNVQSLLINASKYSEDLLKYDIEQFGCLSIQDVDLPYLSEQWAMGYAYRINVIKGRLTDIDRENKAVVISDELVIEYDYMLISTWTQDNSARKIPSLRGVHPSKCADAGIFALGNPAADLLALSWVKRRCQNRTESVAICGTCLKVFTAASGLIRAGIDPSRIICLINEQEDQIEGCKDLTQNALVSQSAFLAGIKQIYWHCSVTEIGLSRTGFIHAIELQDLRPSTAQSNSSANIEVLEEKMEDPNAIPTHLSCVALLLCAGQEYQSCERDIFAAINDCGLAFDGGLVVDKNFQTVDSRIYAVCDYTKFSRIFRNELPHYKYNPRELGAYVAMQILYRHLDPFAQQYHNDLLYNRKLSNYQLQHVNKPPATSQTSLQDMKNRILKFVLPRSIVCELPADVMYFSSNLPTSPNETVTYVSDNSVSASASFGPLPPRRVTSVRFDPVGMVTEVIYVGLDYVEYRNLSLLLGFQESILNNAIHAYRKGIIEDWIEFFRKDWTTAIFLHSFPKLIQSLRKNLLQDKGMLMLLNRIFEKAENTVEDTEMSEFRRNLYGAYGDLIPEITRRLVYTETFEFIKENRDFLPKFYIQSNSNSNTTNN